MLKVAERRQRYGEFFVWSSQLESPFLVYGCKSLRQYRHKSIAPCQNKSIVSYRREFQPLKLRLPAASPASRTNNDCTHHRSILIQAAIGAFVNEKKLCPKQKVS
jgi:hypothetical protein